MARVNSLILFASACLLALAGTTRCHDPLVIEGQVFCDTCNFRFVTRLTQYIPDAKVRVECHNRTTGVQTLAAEGKTDETGTYHIEVEGEHEDDICEIQLLESPRVDCNKLDEERDRARVLITNNSGIVSKIRHANPIGFFTSDPLLECPKVLKELGLSF